LTRPFVDSPRLRVAAAVTDSLSEAGTPGQITERLMQFLFN